MSGPLSPFLDAGRGTLGSAGSGGVPAAHAASTPARHHDALAWRRAFEAAQDGDFSGWFGAVPSSPAAAFARTRVFALPAGPTRVADFSASADRMPADAASHGPVAQRAAHAATSTHGSSVDTTDESRHTTAGSADRGTPADAHTEREAAAVEGIATALTQMLAAEVVFVSSREETSAVLRATSIAATVTPNTVSPIPLCAAAAASPEIGEDRAALDQDTEQAGTFGPRRHTEPGSSPPQPSLRIHAEWSEHGLGLWLGADAALLPALLAVVEQLRQWIEMRGERLARLVCNGSAWIAEATDVPAEPLSERDAAMASRPDADRRRDPSALFPSSPIDDGPRRRSLLLDRHPTEAS